MLCQKSHAAPRKVGEKVFMVGGPDLTDPRDCLCYLVLGTKACVLVDCGAGPSVGTILDLVQKAGCGTLTHLLLTHGHIDHVGAAAELRSRTGCQILIHTADAGILAGGDCERSAAQWYGLPLKHADPDRTLNDNEEIDLGEGCTLYIIHTPGHTPGSISAWLDRGGKRILFGQDIHGPFSPAFGSDLVLWRASMKRLLDLDADILAEGHYGIFKPAQEVQAFIQGQLNQH
ncbi:MAG: MBL fold metallo-hydrolase [Desulfarculaceae bacterium]|jgi:glyoxylase-like metal-dependent hydrolase (beta-lactamase superfamily II)